jgi:AmiR/NasT family two-component response regulator
MDDQDPSIDGMYVYSSRPEAFTDLDVAAASMVAPFAAWAVEAAVDERDVRHLRDALTTSRQIGTAIGMLMARQQLTSDEAFDRLCDLSQRSNAKPRDVAAQFVRTGTVPTLASETVPG